MSSMKKEVQKKVSTWRNEQKEDHPDTGRMKETFIKPVMEIILFDTDDIVASSPTPIGGFPDAP